MELPQRPDQRGPDTQKPFVGSLWDSTLDVLAATVDDFEGTRKALANRVRILTADTADKDGQTRGFGLPEDHPAVVQLRNVYDQTEVIEKIAVKALEKQLRQHPLYPWVKSQNGLGDKTVARLLAAVGDPYWNNGKDANGAMRDRARTVGELFAFCGVAGQQRKQKGVKVNWSPDARMRVWIITGPIIRGKGPYRDVYDAGRAKYADKVHTTTCAQCGKKGAPAQPGDPWRDGHKHAGAIRLVMREVLRDLWTQSRDWHQRQTP